MTKVYISGKYYDKADAKISVYDHGLLYGDGVFEGIRIYDGKVFKLKEHVERLFESARHIKLDIPITREQMIDAIQKTVELNGKRNGYIRPLVTRGSGYLGLDIRKTADPQVVIIVDDISLYPPELYETGMELATVSTIRNHPNALNPRIKSLNYLNNILAKIEAVQAGCVEALMLNHKGEVAECSGDNIFIVKQGVLRTPPSDAGILEGITRQVVIDIARKATIPIQETALTRHDIFTADECFLTGTAAEVIPVVKCDGRVIGAGKPGSITRTIREGFQQVTRQ
ncbi:MAG: branched-chain-amino-acid transaminase [Planctomycetes bacterium]|nr:branched-chain-amino-acid transaminase [Planctomycetota bacterium]